MSEKENNLFHFNTDNTTVKFTFVKDWLKLWQNKGNIIACHIWALVVLKSGGGRGKNDCSTCGELFLSPPTTTFNTAGKNGMTQPSYWDNGGDKVGEVTDTNKGNKDELIHNVQNFEWWDCWTQQFVMCERVKSLSNAVQKCYINLKFVANPVLEVTTHSTHL